MGPSSGHGAWFAGRKKKGISGCYFSLWEKDDRLRSVHPNSEYLFFYPSNIVSLPQQSYHIYMHTL